MPAGDDAGSSPVTQPATQSSPSAYFVHLPGIGGKLFVDAMLVRGLTQGGISRAAIHVYDWTDHDPGVGALLAYQRNQQQAQAIADMLSKQFHEHPHVPICITAHSGGAAVAVWALEKLPPVVHVQTLVLLAPALSPDYDLTGALRHVTGHAYAFTSPYDSIVLGAGTRLLGTMDGVHTDAAGKVGFRRPSDADPAQYAKLVPMPYKADYMQYGDIGDHIGPMMTPFVRAIVAPLLLNGNDRAPGEGSMEASASTTRPAALSQD